MSVMEKKPFFELYQPTARWSLIPEHLQGGVRRYIEFGVRPGSFLTAVFSNNLMDAIGRADDESLAGLKGIVQFVYCETPAGSHGSRESFDAWVAHEGWKGMP